MTETPPKLSVCTAAEFLGTFLLVFFGCGSVHIAVLTGDLQGLWQVGVVWGLAIMLAIYTIGGISGAHINPAVTVALAVWRLFPADRVLAYVVAQFLGALAAAAVLFVLFEPMLAAKEAARGVERGEPGSIITAMCYGEYFPNPGPLAAREEAWSSSEFDEFRQRVCHGAAFLAEALGTAILGFVIVSITDRHNRTQPEKLSPAFIGLTVTALICVLAPLTQGCFNPARDFGPRTFAWLAGWGDVAWPGPNGSAVVTVYLLAPVVGAVCGMGAYQLIFRRHVAPTEVSGRVQNNLESDEAET